MAQQLRIAEIFSSIQGEGDWIGTPSCFVRISGCNLRCVWCDTPYASWNPEGPTREVADIAREISRHGIQHVVITGGEPMLFDAVMPLAETLRATGHVLTIETAGTVFRDLPCDLMSISPKLANSTPPTDSGWAERHERTRTNIDVLAQLIGRYRHQLKFVVNPESGEEDIEQIESLLGRLPKFEPERIFLMPEGTDSSTLGRRMRMLVNPCMARGWRLAPRLHVELFGDTRGT